MHPQHQCFEDMTRKDRENSAEAIVCSLSRVAALVQIYDAYREQRSFLLQVRDRINLEFQFMALIRNIPFLLFSLY